ncbi:MAG: nitroreductase [Hamadaea sp.]|nr:nitroreductase [Hamadaea sp.]
MTASFGGPSGIGTVLAECLTAAIAAPSVHNTQPWRFHLHDDAIDVYADRGRRLEVADPDGRELIISVGAALLNLRVALLAHGRQAMYALYPDAERRDLCARVTVGNRIPPSYAARRLAGAIPRRHSNRRPFRSSDLPDVVLNELCDAARAEGCQLVVADPGLRDAVLSVARTAQSRRRDDADYMIELAAWTGAGLGRRDGVAPVAYAPPDPDERIPLRDFGLAHPARDAWPAVFEDDPVIAVVYSAADSPYAWLRAGQALERVLLTATANGVQSTLMTQPLEYTGLRALFDDTAEGRVAQAILRLGYGPSAPSSSRRLLTEFLMSGPDPVVGRGADPDRPDVGAGGPAE